MLRQSAITLCSVKIVGIDNSKWLADGAGGRQNCVHRAPWLGPICRHGKSWRELVEFLKNVFDRDVLFEPCTNNLRERLLNILTDNEYELAIPGTKSVVDRIIHDGFTTRADGINLLEPPITAAQASGQDE